MSAASARGRSPSTSSRRSSGSFASWRASVNKMPAVEASDAEKRVMKLEELADVPGTYFNPQTEVVVIVDDSASIDQEVFNMEAYEGADWVRISDEVPVDSDALDTALERFQTLRHAPAGVSAEATELEPDFDDPVEVEEELEPDP